MKERILVITACVLSCAVIFGGIIAYKEHKKANADIDIYQSTTEESTDENTSVKEETTTEKAEGTTLIEETTVSNKAPNKKPVSSTKPKETTTVESTTEESTTEETTTEESTNEETTTEKIYPVLAESKEDMVRLINDLTARASQGNYKLTRVCYAEDEFVASDMEKLNEIVQNVNPDATFNSAINEHLGVGTTTATVKNGKATTNIREEYLLKAMSLTVGDVSYWRQYENKIAVTLVSSRSSTAFMHVTNDYITLNDIRTFFSKYSTNYEINGALMGYGPTSLEATIDDGKLTSLKVSISVNADIELSPHNRMEGTYVTETTYSDIVYN